MLLGGHAVAWADEEPNLFEKVAPSIAKLNLSGFSRRSYCTAVQLGQRAALAISYCLQGGRFDQAHLLFGYDRGQWLEERGVLSAYNGPAQSLLKLLCLDRSLPPSSLKRTGLPVAAGDQVIVAGYSAPKAEIVTFHGCKVLYTYRTGEFALDCAARPGSAGSLVFRRDGDDAALLGVLASGSERMSLVLGWTGGHPDDLCPANPN